MRQKLDLSLPGAKELAHLNHLPEEYWGPEGSPYAEGSIRCRMCQQVWPCATRNAVLAQEGPQTVPVPIEALRTFVKLFDDVKTGTIFDWDDVENAVDPHLSAFRRALGSQDA